MNNVYLFQPQYAVEFRKEKNYWIPYSAGCLWAYCAQFADIAQHYRLAEIVFRREHHDDILQRLTDPVVCGFSCYQWNRNYCMALAKKIKQAYPRCVIVFGGPEITVTDGMEPFIDSVVLGEGEQAWLEILRHVRDGAPVRPSYSKARLDVSDFPSPYTMGIFDDMIRDHPGVEWATTLETNRGCPFSCTFCDWGSVTYSKIKKFGLERVAQDLDWIARNPVTYIFCADANFGILKERDLEIARLVRAAGDRSQHMEVFNATFNKNNNAWSFEILRVLGDLNKGLTVSVQSLHRPTLEAIKRDNLGINDLRHIFDLCAEHDVSSYTELILGLPMETKESFIHGICELLELGQHSQIDVWFVDLLTNSELASPMDRFNYGIRSMRTANYLALLNQSEDDFYPEEVELVCATNTMDTEDMIDSYLYAWMVVNFHLQGYSQLTSRYARTQFGISYRRFYDHMFASLELWPQIATVKNLLRQRIHDLLYRGQLEKGFSAHNLLYTEADRLYRCRHEIFDMVHDTFSCLTGQSKASLRVAQSHMVLDMDRSYPIDLEVDFDLQRFVPGEQCYRIGSRFVSDLDTDQDFQDRFYALRRKGFLKTVITPITK